jgi:hypothetical protein
MLSLQCAYLGSCDLSVCAMWHCLYQLGLVLFAAALCAFSRTSGLRHAPRLTLQVSVQGLGWLAGGSVPAVSTNMHEVCYGC